jgi:NAD(P) transhydrogenase subunit alpha
MKIAIPKERRPGERRVAASPETVKKLVGLGATVVVEPGAGAGADIPDSEFVQAGASLAQHVDSVWHDADIILKVQRPLPEEVPLMKKGAVLVAMLAPLQHRDDVKSYAAAGITAFAMELMPRITRAQSMDVLSSQSNLAGYKSVLDGVQNFGRALPMMMTPAGTIAPARVFIMGVGVAGLQAIATARRLGAVVTATDVRPATKEQVESLGGKFIWVDDEEARQSQTSGGYAKEMSAEYRAKQAALIADHIKKQDMVITTALIPGRPAPVLVTEEMVKTMKPGSVIVDLAVEAGGNCPLSRPGEVVEAYGVKIVGYSNVPSRIAVDASSLYAKNLWNFLSPQWDKESKSFRFKWDDETVSGTCVARDGEIVHPLLKQGT